MWLILGIIAIIATIINLFMYKTGKDYRLAMAIGLSFTALTLCILLNQIADSVIYASKADLLDVLPTMGKVLWFLTIVSIGLNITPIFLELKNKKITT